MVEFTLRDFLGVVAAISTLALVLGAMWAVARGVARWAKARGRRPWVWVLGAYAAANIALAIGEALVGGGAR